MKKYLASLFAFVLAASLIAAGPSTITNTSPVSFDPIQALGPLEYFTAYDLTGLNEGASVSSWRGKNGNVATLAGAQAINAGFTAPTFSSGGISGSPSVYFGGSSALVTPSIFSGTYTNVTVAMVVWMKNVQVSDYFFSSFGTDASNRIITTYGQNGPTVKNIGTGFGANKHRVLAGVQSGTVRPYVVVYTYDGTKTWNGSPGLHSIWIDGVCLDGQAGGTNMSLSGPIFIGNLAPGDLLHANLGAIAVWTTTLAPPQIRQVSAYLHDSFLKDNRQRCFVTGDSIGEGTAQTHLQTIVDQLQSAMPQLRFINAARGGHPMVDQVSAIQPYDNLLTSLRSSDIVLMWPGSIDIANGTAVATVEGYHSALVAAAKAQGAYVIQCEMVPKQANLDNISQATSDSHRGSYNTWIDTISNSGADAYVPLTTISGFDTNAGWQSTSNYIILSEPITGVNASGGTQVITLPAFAFHNQRVASVIGPGSTDLSANFETFLSVDGQIKQLSGNLTGQSITVTLNDGSHIVSSATATWVPLITNTLRGFARDNPGSVNLPATTSSLGQVTINNIPYLQGYGTRNGFVSGSGNFSLTGTDNYGNGSGTLTTLTSGGSNIGIGSNVLTSTTTGFKNIAIGGAAGNTWTNEQGNVVIGDAVGFQTPMSNCVVLGVNGALAMTNRIDSCVFIGANAGSGGAGNISFSTAIGPGANVTASNCFVLGPTGAHQPNVGIGITAPTSQFHNAGTTQLGTAGTSFTRIRYGVATLGSGGTVTVNDTNITANTRIILTAQSLGTVSVPAALAVTARSAGTSFTITSANATDTSVVAYEEIEP